MSKYQNLIKQTTVYLILMVLAVSSTTLAQRSRRNDTERETRTSEKDLRKEEMRKEASESFPELSEALKNILEKVVKNQWPEPKIIDQSVQLLEKNKRNGWAYNDKQKAQFMLLQAWTGFYQDNPIDAVRWSMRACKTNEASQDAWISQALFCVLNDKRPMKPRQQKARSQSRRRPRRNVDAEYSAKPKPFSEQGVLQFDLMGFREKVFRQQFGRLEFSSVGGEKIEFEPEGDTLCILLWQDQEEVSDANEPVDAAEQTPEQPAVEMMAEYGMNAVRDRQTPLKEQRDYFRMLKEACKENERIKFVQMNTNAVEVAKRVAGELAQDPSIEEAGLLVLASDPSSNAQKFAGWDAKKPFMTIIGKEGKVKYAGTAADFMPAFILTALTGAEIDLEKQGQMDTPIPGEMAGFDPMLMEGMPTAKTPESVPEPNQPAVDSNNAPPKAPRTVQQSSDFPTQSLEDRVQAENLLRSAQMHIEESRKLHMKNPKQGIEDARRVLKEFPNTEHAQKARELLRRVPDRWKKKHGITDEELGY